MAIDFNNVDRVFYGQTELDRVYQGDVLKWRKKIQNPLRVVNYYAGSNTATLTKNGSAPDVSLEYSFDNSTWTTWTPDGNGVRTVSIPQSGSLYLRGDNPDGFNSIGTDTDYYSFTCSGTYELAGNVNSLLSIYETNILPDYCFSKFFKGSTTLQQNNYMLMPATIIGQGAYGQMFLDCTALRIAPHVLPATADVSRAYSKMFEGCTSLTTMPKIYMTNFGVRTCYKMFYGCTALKEQWASSDPNDTSKENVSFTVSSANGSDCLYAMFRGCTSLTNAANIALSATSLTTACCKSMFFGCTNLTTSPEIMATSFDNGGNTANGSLSEMFYNCSKLGSIKVHFTSWNNGDYTKNWTYGTKSSGTFYKPSSLPSTKNSSGNTSNPNYIPYNWTVQNI